jgi:hypothetical protein
MESSLYHEIKTVSLGKEIILQSKIATLVHLQARQAGRNNKASYQFMQSYEDG